MCKISLFRNTYPYNVFKFLTVPPVTESHNAFLETWAWVACDRKWSLLFISCFTSRVSYGTFCALTSTRTRILRAWESATSPKSCLNESHESSTSVKEFINDHGTLFRSSMKASRLKRLKFLVSITLEGGGFKRCSLRTAKIAEWSLEPTGITPETYRSMVSYAGEIDNDLPQTKLFRHVDKALSRCRFIGLFE